MTKISIAILGSGPSAAYAYRACKIYGCKNIDVYAKQPHTPTGAFWLHMLPKGVSRRIAKGLEARIDILGVGGPVGYAEKMWGKDTETSYPVHAYRSLGYHPRKGLLQIWGKKEKEFIKDAGQFGDEDVIQLATTYDLVIQTFPTDASKLIQPEVIPFTIATKYFSTPSVSHVICIYSGLARHLWVRVTAGFGQVSFEYPSGISPNDIRLGDDWFYDTAYDLPLDTYPLDGAISSGENILLVGRFAQWQRKMLAHEAYDYVTSQLALRFGEKDKEKRKR